MSFLCVSNFFYMNGGIFLENDYEKLSIGIEEARKMLGIGRNLMLELVKLEGFPCIKFKRKILINKSKLKQWFDENYGEYKY